MTSRSRPIKIDCLTATTTDNFLKKKSLAMWISKFKTFEHIVNNMVLLPTCLPACILRSNLHRIHIVNVFN